MLQDMWLKIWLLRDSLLGLSKPIYRQTAAYGHFGRKDLQVPWEWTDKVTALRAAMAK